MININTQKVNIFDMNGTFTLRNTVKIPYLGMNVSHIEEGKAIADATRRALSIGYKYFDTSANYQNEVGFGEAIASSKMNREKVFVSSKIADRDQGFEPLITAFNRTLNNMKLDYLDLVLIQHPIEGKIQESWRALEQLYVERRVRAIGVCNFNVAQLKELIANADVFPVVNQIEYNPLHVDHDIIEFCKENGIQVISIGSLKHGEVLELEEVKKLAEKYDVFPCQIVLRWVLQNGVVSLPQAEIREHIISNSALFNFELTEEDMSLLNSLSSTELV
ncbi:aldo/keto reductase [Flammeovirga pectinis]|uniref:Aldo/keto reductase n=1 Tax=Flammeovirga pectinis TaxID=2494373 RepID=A0A3Q9FQQ3_9BACT|nr:aldo/keto reductase [Flammeovirga pectinis]AZQ62536.1 aldo/keto reductase [Flammeovirga pectinis]